MTSRCTRSWFQFWFGSWVVNNIAVTCFRDISNSSQMDATVRDTGASREERRGKRSTLHSAMKCSSERKRNGAVAHSLLRLSATEGKEWRSEWRMYWRAVGLCRTFRTRNECNDSTSARSDGWHLEIERERERGLLQCASSPLCPLKGSSHHHFSSFSTDWKYDSFSLRDTYMFRVSKSSQQWNSLQVSQSGEDFLRSH